MPLSVYNIITSLSFPPSECKQHVGYLISFEEFYTYKVYIKLVKKLVYFFITTMMIFISEKNRVVILCVIYECIILVPRETREGKPSDDFNI